MSMTFTYMARLFTFLEKWFIEENGKGKKREVKGRRKKISGNYL